MKRKIGVVVIQGAVHVNHVSLVREGPGFVYLEADLRAKRAVVESSSDSMVYLGADGNTLYIDVDVAPTALTSIRVTGLRGDWCIHPTVSSYTCRIYCVKQTRRRKAMFQSEDES